MTKIQTLKINFILFMAMASCLSHSTEFNDHTDFEHYSVYYSIFNSTFIPADIAANYGIKRSKYENLINVSVSPRGKYGALPASVTGTITNLMQQQKTLDFKEIKEKTATYYIAPIRITGKEIVHIELEVRSKSNAISRKEPMKIQFSKTLYADH